jgi:uncharacterized coiled-coil protein SlyX
MNQLYLYVALIGIGFVLFALTKSNKTAAPAPTSTVMSPERARDDELKTALDEFMTELERENVRLLESFSQLQSDCKMQLAEQDRIIRGLQADVARLEAELAEQKEKVGNLSQAVEAASASAVSVTEAPDPESPVPSVAFAFNEKYARVVEMARQGMTPEQIARRTEIGLGEIQMVIGLAMREGN